MLCVFSRRLIKRLVSCTFGNLEWMLSDQRSLPMRCFRRLVNGSVALAADTNNDARARRLPSCHHPVGTPESTALTSVDTDGDFWNSK